MEKLLLEEISANVRKGKREGEAVIALHHDENYIPRSAAGVEKREEFARKLDGTWMFWYSVKGRERGVTTQDWLERLVRSDPVCTYGELAGVLSQQRRQCEEMAAQTQSVMFFRQGIKPLWEEPKNIRGGKFAVALTHGVADAVDLYISAVCGLLCSPDISQLAVNGFVLSFRPWGGTFSLWNSNSKDEPGVKRLVGYLQRRMGMSHVLYQPHRRSIAMNRRVAHRRGSPMHSAEDVGKAMSLSAELRPAASASTNAEILAGMTSTNTERKEKTLDRPPGLMSVSMPDLPMFNPMDNIIQKQSLILSKPIEQPEIPRHNVLEKDKKKKSRKKKLKKSDLEVDSEVDSEVDLEVDSEVDSKVDSEVDSKLKSVEKSESVEKSVENSTSNSSFDTYHILVFSILFLVVAWLLRLVLS